MYMSEYSRTFQIGFHKLQFFNEFGVSRGGNWQSPETLSLGHLDMTQILLTDCPPIRQTLAIGLFYERMVFHPIKKSFYKKNFNYNLDRFGLENIFNISSFCTL